MRLKIRRNEALENMARETVMTKTKQISVRMHGLIRKRKWKITIQQLGFSCQHQGHSVRFWLLQTNRKQKRQEVVNWQLQNVLTTRSPLAFPAAMHAGSHASLLVNTAPWYLPVATPWAPVKVAMSKMTSAWRSFFAYATLEFNYRVIRIKMKKRTGIATFSTYVGDDLTTKVNDRKKDNTKV